MPGDDEGDGERLEQMRLRLRAARALESAVREFAAAAAGLPERAGWPEWVTALTPDRRTGLRRGACGRGRRRRRPAACARCPRGAGRSADGRGRAPRTARGREHGRGQGRARRRRRAHASRAPRPQLLDARLHRPGRRRLPGTRPTRPDPGRRRAPVDRREARGAPAAGRRPRCGVAAPVRVRVRGGARPAPPGRAAHGCGHRPSAAALAAAAPAGVARGRRARRARDVPQRASALGRCGGTSAERRRSPTAWCGSTPASAMQPRFCSLSGSGRRAAARAYLERGARGAGCRGPPSRRLARLPEPFRSGPGTASSAMRRGPSSRSVIPSPPSSIPQASSAT